MVFFLLVRGGEGMTISTLILKIAPEEAARLTRILLHGDERDALLFLKECLKPQLDQLARNH